MGGGTIESPFHTKEGDLDTTDVMSDLRCKISCFSDHKFAQATFLMAIEMLIFSGQWDAMQCKLSIAPPKVRKFHSCVSLALQGLKLLAVISTYPNASLTHNLESYRSFLGSPACPSTSYSIVTTSLLSIRGESFL